jgi:malate dehydrogenase (oxaloacetate-decarboxylating)
VFPWIFKWALEAWVNAITDEMKIKAAEWLASFVKKPTSEKIIPGPFEPGIAELVAESIK